MRYFLFFIAVTLLWGCEKELSINITPNDGVVVAYSFLYPDSTFKLHLSESVSITSTDKYGLVNDALVLLKRNGTTILNEPFPNGKAESAWSVGAFVGGDVFELEVNIPDKELVLASTVIPLKPNVIGIDTITELRRQNDGEFKPFLKFNIDFVENQATTDYYQLIVTRQGLQTSGEQIVNVVDVVKEDPVFSFLESGANLSNWFDFKGLFSDVLINGQDYQLKFLVDKSLLYLKDDEQSGDISVYLYHHTYDYFEYHKTYILSKGTDFFPMFDPVMIHSNVTNGLGLFSGMTFELFKYDLVEMDE